MGTRLAAGRCLGEGRGRAACGAAEAGAGSCCSRAEDTSAPWWVVGKRRVGAPEGAQRAVGTRGGGTAGWAGRSWAAWARRRGLLSSSWTAGSESPPPTCRSCWWTLGSWRAAAAAGGGGAAAAAGAEAGRAAEGVRPQRAARPQQEGPVPGLCALLSDERQTSCEKRKKKKVRHIQLPIKLRI